MKKTLNRILATFMALVLAIPMFVATSLPTYALETDDEIRQFANSLLTEVKDVYGMASDIPGKKEEIEGGDNDRLKNLVHDLTEESNPVILVYTLNTDVVESFSQRD